MNSLKLGICLLFVSCILLLGASAEATNAISVGYIKAGSSDAWSLSWRPDFKFGAWGLGFDFNAPLGNVRPDGYESFVFRYAEYDDGQKGLRYGFLSGVTWGHGLLVKNYSTRIGGPIIASNNQMGIRGYYNWDIYGLSVLNTWSHIYGVRVTEKVKPVEFLPMLTLGQGYIVDSDGVSVKQTNGTTRNFPSQAGFEVDATMPLPLGFNGYAEYARLMNYGQGGAFGVDWGIDLMAFAATFDVGYRMLGSEFSPGYFDLDYEINPTDLTSIAASSRNGYFAEFRGIASDYLQMQIMYEAYHNSNTALWAEATTKPRDDIFASAYYKQPKFIDFKSLSLEEGAIIGGKVGYKVNPYTTVITHYKKAYDPTAGKVVETQYYEVELSF